MSRSAIPFPLGITTPEAYLTGHCSRNVRFYLSIVSVQDHSVIHAQWDSDLPLPERTKFISSVLAFQGGEFSKNNPAVRWIVFDLSNHGYCWVFRTRSDARAFRKSLIGEPNAVRTSVPMPFADRRFN